MKQDIKITLKLITGGIALLIIWAVVQNRYGAVSESPLISEDEAVENGAGAEQQYQEPQSPDAQNPERTYLFTDIDPDRNIRVLLTNPAGGYFFDEVTVCLKERTYRLGKKDIRRRGTVRIQADGEQMEFLQKKGKDRPALYPGDFVLRSTQDGIYVVNSVPLEQYLALVVPGEMPADYPEEALKSQAVLARTYAIRFMLHPALPEYFADLDDTTGYQVYAGSGRQASADKAVEDTSGSILCAGECVADVYYFSTSCGQTTTTAAWNRADRSMRKAEAQQEADRSIQMTAAQSDATAVSEKAVYVGTGAAAFTAEALQDDKTFEAFIQNRHEAHFEKDVPWYRWEYAAEVDSKRLFLRIRDRYEINPAQVLSRQSGKSDFTDVYLTDPGRIRDIRVTERSPGGCVSELMIIGTKGDIKIRTEYNIRYVLCDTVSEAVLQDGAARRMETILPSAFFAIKTGKDRQDVIGYTLVGGGFGHGIGMSQNGAAAMAKAGFDCRQIIAFFYPAYQLMQLQRLGEI